MMDVLSRLAGLEPTASTELLDKVKTETRLRDSWKADVDKLHGIIGALGSEYAEHKRGCNALSRYGYVKFMIKSAMRQQNALSNVISGGAEADSRNIAADCVEICTELEKIAQEGLAGRASEFQLLATAIKDRASSDYTVDRTYAALSREEVEREVKQLQRETIYLKRDYKTLRDSLATLQQRYEQSKRLNPLQRYAALKAFVKEAIVVELCTETAIVTAEVK